MIVVQLEEMAVRPNRSSGGPIDGQLVERARHAIEAGALGPPDELPEWRRWRRRL